jgi:hypothetical protein
MEIRGLHDSEIGRRKKARVWRALEARGAEKDGEIFFSTICAVEELLLRICRIPVFSHPRPKTCMAVETEAALDVPSTKAWNCQVNILARTNFQVQAKRRYIHRLKASPPPPPPLHPPRRSPPRQTATPQAHTIIYLYAILMKF